MRLTDVVDIDSYKCIRRFFFYLTISILFSFIRRIDIVTFPSVFLHFTFFLHFHPSYHVSAFPRGCANAHLCGTHHHHHLASAEFVKLESSLIYFFSVSSSSFTFFSFFTIFSFFTLLSFSFCFTSSSYCSLRFPFLSLINSTKPRQARVMCRGTRRKEEQSGGGK